MNKQKCSNSFRQLAGICLLVLLACIPGRGHAQTIPNPSFEANAFTVFPGYVSNNVPITGWTVSPTNRVGLNPAAGSPFANNGATPDGTNVAFVQSTGSAGSSLGTTITGLLPGAIYQVTFRANCRSGFAVPNPTWSLNGGSFNAFTASPAVGGANGYYTNSGFFTATGVVAALVLSNFTAGDSAVLVDDFAIANLGLVTTTNDFGPGSLRDAVATANSFGGDALITFAPALAGATLTLGSQIVITNDLRVDASDLTRNVTIDGGPGGHRLFRIETNSTVAMLGLTLTGGNGDSDKNNRGGAIYNDGILSLTDCNIVGNSTSEGFGGGILNNRHLTMNQCTIANNTSERSGGGVNNFVSTSVLFATNCTFAGNASRTQGGGGLANLNNANSALVHCTFTGNQVTNAGQTGGGILLGAGTVNLINSIVTSNTAPTAPDLSGTIAFGGTNLTSGDALLGPLGNYGGRTLTLPLLPGSPAIDASVGSATAADQRGAARPIGITADLGALEYQPPRVVTSTNDSGAGTLRQTLADAFPGDIITFTNTLSGRTIGLTSGELPLTKNVTIDASGLAGGLKISGNNSSRIFGSWSGMEASLIGLTLTGGASVAGGAIVVSSGVMNLENCTLSGNAATGAGAIWAQVGAVVTMKSCTISSNTASQKGGALLILDNSFLASTNCTFFGNSAVYSGAIQFENNVRGVLSHTTVAGNSANNAVDGILAFNSSSVTLANSIIANNGEDFYITADSSLTKVGTNILVALTAEAGSTNNGSGVLLTADPLLAPLGVYGGPTRTMALLPGSPAMDAAAPTALTTDQRGYSRAVGSAADIGAYERQLRPIANVATNEDRNIVVPFTVGTVGTLTATSSVPGFVLPFIFGGSGTDRTLTVRPTTNSYGTATITITDSPSRETVSFDVTFSPVNDAPNFTAGINQGVLNTDGPQVVPNWATAISPGPTNEAAQAVSFIVTSDNSSLFSQQPAVSPDGTLTYVPAPGASGTATVSVRAQDDGGTANGGADLSVIRNFTIRVLPADALTISATTDGVTGSLRQAVLHSSLLTGPDRIITFAPGLSGATLTLTNQISVSNSFTLDGSSLPGGITIDGGAGANRLFVFNFGTTNVLIGLNLTGGAGSGGSGGAIYNFANLTVIGCTFNQNTNIAFGGAIASYAPLQLTNCTFANNSAYYGGALYVQGGATISHCTLSGNAAATNGGALYDGGSTQVTIHNSILYGNSIPGLPIGGGSDLFILGGSVNLTGSNIIRSVQGAGLNGNRLNMNPLLGPLVANGSATKTMALLPGSPARDAAVDSELPTDQRGLPRPFGAFADIGAYEAQSEPGDLMETLFVTTAADEFDPLTEMGAGLSLREAICRASIGTAINFSTNLSGATITLTRGELVLDKNLDIDASALAGGVTISGNGFSRIFHVNPVRTNTLTSLTITGGSAGIGGGILNQGNLTVLRCSVVGNSGDGLFNDTSGLLSIFNSTVAGNSQSLGGGIENSGILNLNHATITGNQAVDGGGLIIYNGTVTMTNTIIAGNTNNSPGNAQDIRKYAGPAIIAGGVNLVGDLTGSSLSAGPDILVGAPLLAPLGNYGGPTPTRPPLSGSPAIDGSTAGTVFATDQRGFARLNGAHADIGATESDVSPIVTTLANDGIGSLRYAINYLAADSTITFAPELSGQTILLTNGQLRLTRNITIDASSLSNGLALDGNAASRIFDVTNNVNVMLAGLTITNGLRYSENGGGIRNAGNLTVSNCVISRNAVRGTDNTGATVGGGGIYNSSTGTLALFGSSLTGNSATGGRGGDGPSDGNGSYGCCDGGGGGRGLGGGIHNEGALTLEGNTLWANSAAGGRGGNAGHYTGGSVGNAGRGGDAYGGGIHSAGSLVLRQNTFFGNIATGGGGGNGAVDGSGGDGGHGWGGGVFNNGSLSVNQSTLTENSVFGGGLGAYQFGTPAVGSGRGGGIYNASINDVGLTNTIATGNFASFHTLAGETNLFGAHTDGGANLTNGLPLLAPFGYYGGRTPTMPPRAESPATDGCTNGTEFAADQRGLPRSYGLFADIGAAEAHSFMPTVVTLPATGVTNATATLQATINPNTNATTAWFEWGASTNYGNQTAPVFVGDGGAPLPVSANISGFIPGITYRFRVVATNETGIAYGNDIAFGSPVLTLIGPAVVTNECHAPFAVTLPVLANPSFEANKFTISPGYARGNGGSISGWTISDTTRIGLNTASGPFADNGPIPNGVNCAFVQSTGNNLNTLSQTVTGFMAGVTYQIRFRSNRRSATTPPNPTWSLDGSTFVPFTASPAAGTNGYYTNSLSFTAASNSIQLVIANQSTNDSAVLVDDFSITPSVVNPAGSPVTVSGYFDPDTPGTYTLTYSATNALGGVGTITRNVVVQCTPVTPPVIGGVTRLGGGAFQFSFSSSSNTAFSILASTNVAAPAAQWTNLGPAVEVPPGSGQYQFTDPQATNHPARFYRVVQP